MNKQTEALKMAIAELEKGEGWMDNVSATIQACKEALAQPAQEYLTRAQQVIRANNSAQEPVAWTTKFDTTNIWESPESPGEPFTVPLYTHTAPSWQGLSDDDMEKAKFYDESFYNGARWAEQALKEKNHG